MAETKQEEEVVNTESDQAEEEDAVKTSAVDLSVPLKRVERPDKDKHEAILAGINDEIEKLKVERREIQAKIDEAMDSSKPTELSQARDEIAKLRSKKGALISEKKAIRSRLDQTRNQSERLFEGQRATKQSVKYNNVADIEAQIKKLKHRQETTSMSLTEEKRLLKEIETLQASKGLVAQMKTQETDIENIKEQRKQLAVEISAKDKEIDAVQAEIDKKNASIKELADKESDTRGKAQEMFGERDKLRNLINIKIAEKENQIKSFRAANDDYYNNQRALRAQRKAQREEERRKRDEEREAYLKKLEEEELKKVPYEEEMTLCDYLADYLTKTYLSEGKEKAKKEEVKEEATPKLEDNPFAGLTPMNKKKDEDVYLKMGKGKKPRQRQSKKDKKQTKAVPFTLNVDTFEQFGLLNLTPPTSIEMVQGSVDALIAKKKWYSEQPRGSVPTAAEIRRANEKAAQQLKKGSSDQSRTATNSTAKSEFSLSHDDFVPLGGAAQQDTSVNATWGKTSAQEDEEEEGAEEEEAAAEEEATAEIEASE